MSIVNMKTEKGTKANETILRELIKRGYSKKGGTRVWDVSDSKLWYLTPEQAQAYLDLVSGEKYQEGIGPKELSMLNYNMNDILKDVVNVEGINIIDLGCGDGKKGNLFIKNMKDKVAVRYCPIDISGYMVEKAIENVSNINKKQIITFQWNVSDFENLENIAPLLRKNEFKKNLFLLLGNTFGNFETHEILYNITSGMNNNDLLLVGNGLNNGKIEEDIVKSCRENIGFDKFLSLILLEIGLKKNEIKYDVRFKHSRIEFFYTILTDKKISFQDKNIYFAEGDQVVVAIAYHYKKNEFSKYLKMYFDNVKLYTSKDDSYGLALCKK